MTKQLKTIIFICLTLILIVTGLVFSVIKNGIEIPILPFFSSNSAVMHDVRPLKSNQWYSTIYTAFPTQPLYAFPLAFRMTDRGLGFSYPDIISQPNTIFAPYNEDFSVGIAKPFTKATLDAVSDWSITASLHTNTNDFVTFTIGHGIPFTKISSSQKGFILKSIHPIKTQLSTTNALVEINNHHYLLAVPDGTIMQTTEYTLEIASDTLFVALLDKQENYDRFLAIADTQISGTRVDFQIHQDTLLTNYTFHTEGKIPLVALLPHQYDFLTKDIETLGIYKTLRGDMRLVQTKSFTTKLPLLIPPLTFERFRTTPKELKRQIQKDTQTILSQKVPESKNYYLGTYFGKIVTLIQLADIAGLPEEKQHLINHLTPLFIDSLQYFSYDKEKTSLIAEKSEFGNDQLNDHHFHYGYYIRTAAVLLQYDPSLLNKIQPTIAQMVADIATIDRKDSEYPFLRTFDIYEGHSWAGGLPNFTDGNNQESSSEALNAWYAIYLWAQITKDKNLEHYALYLFNTELISTRYYWFDEKHIYTPPYKHAIASIVWGGKVDFNTWFSSETNKIYGIQLLPITPASIYLSTIKDFPRYEKDFLAANGSYDSSWGELMAIWRFITGEKDKILSAQTITDPETNTTQSVYIYFLLNQ